MNNNDEPIRVLQVLGKLQIGGAETLVMNMYRNIEQSKIRFDFLVHGNEIGDYEKEIIRNGGKVYHIPKYKLINHHQYKKELNKIFKKNKYDIVHCHIRSTATIILRNAKKYNIVRIAHSHATSNGKGIKAITTNIMQFGIRYNSDYFFACSQKAAKWLFGKKKSLGEKCIIINNGIDSQKFKYNDKFRNEIRRKYNVDPTTFLIGHIGRFEQIKNHDFIVKIAKKLCKENKKISFMLCGEGKLKKSIVKKTKKYNLDKNIIFAPATKDIHKYYSAFDMFILPSKKEGLGIVLIEAQSCGVYSLTSNGIPKEACVSNKIKQLELNEKIWIKEIINYLQKQKNENTVYNENFKLYDIKEICNKVERLYFSFVNMRR